MTDSRKGPEIELTETERRRITEERKRAAAAQKGTADARASTEFVHKLAQEVQTLKLQRFDRLCQGHASEGRLGDEALARAAEQLFGECWWEMSLPSKAYAAFEALIARTEPARQAERDKRAREIRDNPRDY